MTLSKLAGRILDIVETSEVETRYEEKSYLDQGRRIEGANPVLRSQLGAVERLYPHSGERCDLVFPDLLGPVWLETKLAWTWQTYRQPAGPNRSYQKHLFGESGTSALLDARAKLPTLVGRPDVGVIGMLLIVLDSTSLPAWNADIERYAILAGLGQAPWQYQSRPRWMSRVRGYEPIGIQAHLWLREACSQAAKLATGVQ